MFKCMASYAFHKILGCIDVRFRHLYACATQCDADPWIDGKIIPVRLECGDAMGFEIAADHTRFCGIERI